MENFKNKRLITYIPYIIFAIFNLVDINFNEISPLILKYGIIDVTLGLVIGYLITNVITFPLAFLLDKNFFSKIGQETYSNTDQAIVNALVQKFNKNNTEFSFKNINKYYQNDKNLLSYFKEENISFHHNILIYDNVHKHFYIKLVEASKNGFIIKENDIDSLEPMCRIGHNEPDDLLFCLEWLFHYDNQFKIDYYYECKDKIDFIRNNYSYLTDEKYKNNEDVIRLKKKVIQFKNDLNDVYQKYVQSMSDPNNNSYYNLIENYGNNIETSKIKEQLIKASVIEAKN